METDADANPKLDGPREPAPGPGSAPGTGPRGALHRVRRFIRALWLLVAVLGALLVLRTWVVAPYRIPTASMEPTLRGDHPGDGIDGDTVLVLKSAYWLRPPRRWDLVAFAPLSERQAAGSAHGLVKRVVGLPGEMVEIRGGAVLVDGAALELPPQLAGIEYRNRGRFGNDPFRLGDGEYFVLGDNAEVSEDGRHWGPLPRERIFGRVVAIIRPWARAGWVK